MTLSAVEARRAAFKDLETVVPLFDAYRQFYRQSSDQKGARPFLRECFYRNESVIYLAWARGAAIGFTQLYPCFSPGAMRRIFILNDLFVAPEAPERGMGSALLDAAAEYGRRHGAIRLTLSTDFNNTAAQSVYERRGWRRDSEFVVHHLTL